MQWSSMSTDEILRYAESVEKNDLEEALFSALNRVAEALASSEANLDEIKEIVAALGCELESHEYEEEYLKNENFRLREILSKNNIKFDAN